MHIYSQAIFLQWNMKRLVLFPSTTGMLNNAECYVFITMLTLNAQWINSCTEEAFVLWLHLCVACSCVLIRGKQCFSLCLCTLHILYSSFAGAGIHICVSGSICVCLSVHQTPVPVLHPLLHLVSQLHTRRERGLSAHVCTTHVSSLFTLHLLFVFALLNNITATDR